jgi:hypothetical protein
LLLLVKERRWRKTTRSVQPGVQVQTSKKS